MGIRIRKSINIGKHFKVNLSKSGVGFSAGVKGFRVTRTANGKYRKTITVPGTGISYVDESKDLLSFGDDKKKKEIKKSGTVNDKIEKKIEKIEETVSEEPERKEEKIISLKTNYRDSDE